MTPHGRGAIEAGPGEAAGDAVRGRVLRPTKSDEVGATATVRVAAFSSPGLESLGRSVGLPLAIVAVTTDPDAHLRRMVRDQHACWCMAEDWIFGAAGGIELDPLAPAFQKIDMDRRWLGDRRSPSGVAVDSGSLLVTLSTGASPSTFADEFRRGMRPSRMDVFGARPGAVLRRRMTGRPLALAPRYACPGGLHRGATGFRFVDDLYVFRPKSLPGLVAAVEAARGRALARGLVDSLIAAL